MRATSMRRCVMNHYLFLALLIPLTGCATPTLVAAARDGQLAKVRAELDRGASINDTTVPWTGSFDGSNALTMAAMNGRLDVVKLLIERGADVNFASKGYGMTALQWAVDRGHTEVVKTLLDHGADVNLADRSGDTPLIYAALHGNSGLVRLLLQHGADSARIGEGRTAEGWAALNHHEDTARLLREWQGRSGQDAGSPVSAPSVGQSATKPSVPAGDIDDKPAYAAAENPNNFALVIGIEKYSNLPDAEFAEHDASAIRAHLLSLGYPESNVVALTGAKATRTAFEKVVESWLPKNVNVDSTVFVYFSGHGAPDPKNGEAFLMPWDGDPEFLEGSAYPVKRLYEKLGALKVKRVIVALDSCFSGAGGRSVLAKGTRPLVTKLDIADLKPGKVVVLTASDGDQISGTIEDRAHGAFTYYLLKGLNGAAQDASSNVTLRSLYDYLRPRVQAAAHRRNREQTPQLLPASAADVIVRAR